MKYTLNLATGTYVNHRRLYVVFTIICLLLLGLLVINSLSVFKDINRTRELQLRIDELQRQNRGASSKGQISGTELTVIKQRIETANELLVRDNYRWTALLDQIEGHLADGISIRGLQPDYKTGVLKLSGVAATVGDLRNFIDKLSQSTVFTHIYLKEQRAEKSKDNFSEGISFSIELQKRGGNES